MKLIWQLPRCVLTLAALTCTLWSAEVGAQVVQTELHIERLDPRMDRIAPPQTKMERMATGFSWVEGPIWTSGGYLLFAEIPSNSIRKVMPNGETTIWMQPSGYVEQKPFGGKEPGSNGMTYDLHGRLVIAGHGARNVYRLETLDPRAPHTVLADTYQGKRFNSPNDVVFRSNGDLYFTDPPYGLPTQRDADPAKEMTTNGVYLVRHADAQKPGAPPDHAAIQLLVGDLTRPNGIAFSPDEKYLYVNNSEAKKAWYRFRVAPDGTLTDRMVFADASGDKRPGGPDGMKVDSEGNIYSSGPGGIWVIAPDGKHIGTFEIPSRCSNVAWGGDGLHTLYITADMNVFRIVLPTHGIAFQHK